MSRRTIPATATTALITVISATPIFAQAEGVPLAQLERKYRNMNEVHILKCDYDGNEVFTRTEVLCVQNIYWSLYLDRN